MKRQRVILHVDEEESTEQINPRLLFAGVLEGVIHDLTAPLIPREHVRSARNWLSGWEDGLPDYISFKDVCTVLDYERQDILCQIKKSF